MISELGYSLGFYDSKLEVFVLVLCSVKNSC